LRYIKAFGWTENTGVESPHFVWVHGKDLSQFLNTKQPHKIITISETADIVIQNINVPDWIYKIYSTNLNVKQSNSCNAIPYGILPRQADLIERTNKNQQKQHLLYLNFNTNTHRSRGNIYNILKNKSFVYDRVNNDGQKQNTDEAYFSYYNDIAQSKFVLCPRGNGIDTYRMWEVLYLGGFPIVEKTLFTSHFVNKLPILEIENWYNLDETFLLSQYNKMINTNWEWEILDCQYWINKWKQDIECLINNLL